MDKLYIEDVLIENFKKHGKLGFQPGKLVHIRGKNGSGKSSVEDAILTALGLGDTINPIREGETEGKIMLGLSGGLKIRHEFSTMGKNTVVTDPERGKLKAPATVIKKITDMVAVNPMKLLTADDKTRAKFLVEALDSKLTPEEIEMLTSCGIKTHTLEFQSDHLGWLDGARKEIFTYRTDVNRNIRDNEGEIAGLEEKLPAKVEVADLAALESELETLRAEYSVQKTEYEAKRKSVGATITQEYQPKKDEIDAEYARRLKEIDDWKAGELKVLNEELTAKIDEAHQKLVSEMEGVDAEYQPQINDLGAKVATAREQQKQAENYDNQRRYLTEKRGKVEGLKATVETLTQRIDTIDQVKNLLMTRVPVRGLEVRDGEVYIDGFPWKDVNTARRVGAAFDLSDLRMGELRTRLLDDAEHLDPETRLECDRQAIERGIQLFLTVVDAGDFQVLSANSVDEMKELEWQREDAIRELTTNISTN